MTSTTQSLGGVNVSGSGPVGACPVGWSCADIGSPAISGSQTALGNGVWMVTGSGSDIWGTSDQFHYMSQAQSGDGSVSAQVASQQQTDAWAKAGVMLRASSSANAAFYAVLVTPQHTISVQARTSSGGSAIIQASAAYTPGQGPTYVQVTRSGTTYSAATSPDGKTWTPISGSSLSISALSGTVQAGIAVTSHTTGAASTATLAAITLAAGGAPATPPASVSSYTLATSYNDAGQPTSLTYSDGEVFSPGYNSDGWLTSAVTVPQGGAQVNLLTAIGYSGVGGAAMHPTSATVGNGTYSYSASFDDDVRLANVSESLSGGGTTLFSSSRTYDNVGNVATVATTLAAGTDTQAFCYDEQNRLTWAGSSGTPPCTGTPISAGSLTTAAYTAAYSYDALNRLTSAPTLGSYSYGASPVHAATSTASGGTVDYSASYDAAGDMTCRAASASVTCPSSGGGGGTGASLGYDNEQRLASWQDAAATPSTTDAFLYDGDGDRVAQQVTTGLPGSPSTTTTIYIGNIEEVATNGSTTTTTTYYYAGQLRIAVAINGPTTGTLAYLCTDALDSTTVALSSSGSGGVTADQLYGPYGAGRYASGTMPTDYGYTGQHSDSTTGLDYYNARYYDPVLSQFTSADTTIPGNGYDPWGLSHYAYVEGNPLIRTDPTGHDGLFGGLVSAVSSAVSTVASTVVSVAQAAAPVVVGVLDAATGISSMVNDVKTIFSGNASLLDKVLAGADLLVNVVMDVTSVVGLGEGLKAAYIGMKAGAHLVEDAGVHAGCMPQRET